MKKTVFDYINLLVSIIGLFLTWRISKTAYDFSLREKRERYKKELEDYYSFIEQYVYILKLYYFKVYTSFDLYLEHDIYYGDYKNFIKDLLGIFEKYDSHLENIINEISRLENCNSIHLFFNKYPKYSEYYLKCSKDYKKFQTIVHYVTEHGLKNELSDNYISDYAKTI